MYIRDYFKDVTWTELSMRGNFLVHEILRSWHKHGRKNQCIWEIKLLVLSDHNVLESYFWHICLWVQDSKYILEEMHDPYVFVYKIAKSAGFRLEFSDIEMYSKFNQI